MPNILLTNKCNQKCSYCFAQDEMNNEKKLKEMSFINFKKTLDFLEKSDNKIVRLMGGEPTLHSRFKEIVEYSLKNKFLVQIFTNGIFNDNILKFLLTKKDLIKYSFNLNHPERYDKKTWKLINKNIKELSVFEKVLIGGVVSDKNFNIDYLIKIADENKIINIALRPDNTVDKNKDMTKAIIREIKKNDKKRFKIGFGCGLSKKYRLINNNWGCDGNSGRFDIGTDLSVFRCFPLSNWKTKKLFDFNNIQEIEKYFNKLMEKYQINNSKEDFIHQGPCFSYLLSK